MLNNRKSFQSVRLKVCYAFISNSLCFNALSRKSIVVSLVVSLVASAFCSLHCRRLYLFVVCRLVCWTSEKSIALGGHREWDFEIPVNFLLSFQIKQQKQQLSQSTQWICEWQRERMREREGGEKTRNWLTTHCAFFRISFRPVVISRHMAGLIKFASLQWQSRISLISTRSRT